MIKICKSVITVMVMTSFLLVVGLSGCKEGPAERAGKSIDKTIEKGKDQVDKLGK